MRFFASEAVSSDKKSIKKRFVAVIAMFLMSVSCFLRESDLLDIQMVDFKPEDSVMLANGVLDHIAFSSSGKGELNVMVRVCLILWQNRVSQLLNPINWLLFHLSLSNIRDGYVFPSSCCKYAEEIKRGILTCFPSEDWSQSCTHIRKKTAYMFARLGNGEIELIARGARNRTAKTVETYDRDIATLKEVWAVEGISFSHLVDQWRPQFLLLERDGRTSNTIRGHRSTASTAVPIAQVVENWCQHFKSRFPGYKDPERFQLLFEDQGEKAKVQTLPRVHELISLYLL